MHTGRNTASERSITSEGQGFTYELTEKQKFYLYLSVLCSNLDILHGLWEQYVKDNDKEKLQFHLNISPFRPHPCGNDCIFHPIAGFIDPDMFLEYYEPRENYLISLEMIGHAWFICQFARKKEDLEQSVNYFDTLINESQIKLSPLKKNKVLEKTIDYLSYKNYKLNKDQIMRYLLSLYNMYKDVKVLHAYPLAIDCDGSLCRFE